jgi:hypothetical protein
MSIHAKRFSSSPLAPIARKAVGDIVAIGLVRFNYQFASAEIAAIDKGHCPTPIEAIATALVDGDRSHRLHVVLYTRVGAQVVGSGVVIRGNTLPRSLKNLLEGMNTFSSGSLAI